ncbi:GNAT family N-acetyltransferase [Paenibacillus tengchongensis]|uniref:GNAT family N-acetyltransferase n=1 Tax=Paenibacillus tengchongensis TaxID=2608684 RepID=UPI00165244BC|nr:GNAT family N-acetyltransferase [Paenibacillus tengchongensis]
MIRKLAEADREAVLSFLGAEAALNLFLIGDVENYGFSQEFMEVWGETEGEDGPLKAVLLRYYSSYLPYARGPFNVEGFAALIGANTKAEMISGSAQVAEAFRGQFNFRLQKQMHFSELAAMTEEVGQACRNTQITVKKAGIDDVEAICALTDIIEEFAGSGGGMRTGLRQSLQSGTGRTYYAERDGKVIACASTSAENSLSAMIVGVATHPDYRKQGLARSLVAQLCSDLLAEGKSLCLFYDNPKAAELYEHLGFRRIGSWRMMYLQH